MSASPATVRSINREKPRIKAVSSPSTSGRFLMLEDSDRRELQRLCNGVVQTFEMLFLLRLTWSAPERVRAVAITVRELAEELSTDETTAERAIKDACERGMVKRWTMVEAIDAGVVKAQPDVDPRTWVYEPLRKEWPKLESYVRGRVTEAAETKEAAPKPHDLPGHATIRPGRESRPIELDPTEDKHVTVQVAPDSLPVSVATLRKQGTIRVIVSAEAQKQTESEPNLSRVDAGKEKAKTLEDTALIVKAFLTPLFEELYSRPIDDKLATRISISLADTPFGYFRTVVAQKLKGDRSKIRTGLFVTLAEQACENYGAVILRQINAQHNGHAKEDPTTKSEFTQWAEANGLAWTTGGELDEAMDRYERETGKKVW